jgi:hypothetical protein
MMAVVLIGMLVIMGAAASGALGQAYPGPSQRIEPTQPMQSLQPMQPIAPIPNPPMRAPGDNPGNGPQAPQAADPSQGSSGPPATGAQTPDVRPTPACSVARHEAGTC